MAVHYNEGESKKRPGLYQRTSNSMIEAEADARNGICAIPVQAAWGPLGKVVKNVTKADLVKNYGAGAYSAAHTVPAAAEMFNGGAVAVYTYRLGTGGTKASKELASGITATAKHPGAYPISIAVQEKLGDSTKKQLLIYADTALVETWNFIADGENEGKNLVAAVAESKYIDVTGTAATVPVLAAAAGALEGGANPTVTNEDYSKAFAALEPYFYNTIALDVDDEDMALSLLLQAYLANVSKLGKYSLAVVGQKTNVAFATRCAKARAFNDNKVVYLGGGWMSGKERKDGVMAICYTAGVIASAPANDSITHTVITGATELCESLTYSQYEDAIDSGMLMVSLSTSGNIWFDSGINTLVTLDPRTQDEGWKKIRRAKTRTELFDRLDRALAPKVGRVTADSDGVADIVQTGQRIVDAMVGEGKLMSGATFCEDTENPYSNDSAWFVIQADDYDSLEKIYMHYQFRNSQNSNKEE